MRNDSTLAHAGTAEIWLRAGLKISGDKSLVEKIVNGDEAALAQALCGYDGELVIDGETYIPSDAAASIDASITEDVEFDVSRRISPQALLANELGMGTMVALAAAVIRQVGLTGDEVKKIVSGKKKISQLTLLG